MTTLATTTATTVDHYSERRLPDVDGVPNAFAYRETLDLDLAETYAQQLTRYGRPLRVERGPQTVRLVYTGFWLVLTGETGQ